MVCCLVKLVEVRTFSSVQNLTSVSMLREGTCFAVVSSGLFRISSLIDLLTTFSDVWKTGERAAIYQRSDLRHQDAFNMRPSQAVFRLLAVRLRWSAAQQYVF